ncbi:Gfo/Idh/MocA family protein [Streptomyces nigrescens]|uniref:Gfo/Idh/MocA family protein n=1 Tax=Streptomyces nigrescens TaxID=1920 RepID=UPI002251D3AC|nr:Gfo/Idh/MocA family oxidoreductase [Streptomyces libani]MCX5443945.1 Gfo/Idh/MocA family oxidoreductase [Streptomyces libani]
MPTRRSTPPQPLSAHSGPVPDREAVDTAAARPVRFGALGTSSFGGRRVLPAMTACPQTELVAVGGRSPERSQRFADRFGCAGSSMAALLERDDIDAVYISLPPSLHGEWAARALHAGKHVLVEKPIATTAAEARAVVRLAEDRDLVLRENFMFLHHPQHDAVADLIAEGRLGGLRSFRGAFCFPPLPTEDIRYVPGLGGGALLDAGVYPLRAAAMLLGPGLRVAGATARVRQSDGLDLSGQALLVSPSGVLASVEFGFEHAYGSSYSLWGEGAKLTVGRAFTPPAAYQPVLVLEEQDHVEKFTLPAADQLTASLAGFAAAVTAGGAAASPREARWRQDAVAMMELVDAVRAQAVRVTVEG